MKNLIVPAALAATIMLAPAAFAAATMTSGAVKAVDVKAQTFTLDNGVTYHLPKGFKNVAFKVGSKVKIDWEMMGKVHQADTISIVK
jgi:Protein of unknown function (DUF1344)